MERGIGNSKLHIANSRHLQDYECSICYELSPDTFRCKGPCHRPLCLNCICRIKATHDVCPSKCSTPLQIENIPHFCVSYQCPYQPSLCKVDLLNVEQFWHHCKNCDYSTVQGLKELQNKEKFQCQKGHSLIYMTPSLLEKEDSNIDFYTSVMNGSCKGCGWHGLCRATCKQCSSQRNKHVYCVECRRCPMKRDKCQQGHSYAAFNVKGLYAWVCDLCGKAGTLYSQWGAFDEQCNIFICSPCFQELPQPESSPVYLTTLIFELQHMKMH